MPEKPSKERGQSRSGVPPRYPETTPLLTPSSDYTYVLEAVMHMRQSIGELTEGVRGLKESRTEQNKKLDAINDKLEKLSSKIYAGIVVIMLGGALLGIFGKAIVEVIADRVFPRTVQSPQNVAPQQPPAALPTQQSQKTP